MAKSDVQALLFDVFGTVVDWRGSLIADLTAFGAAKGITANWDAIVDDWRGLYQPSMEAVRSGKRAWTILDVLHRESLDKLVAKFDVRGPGGRALTEAELDHMNRAWHRLAPWPDVVEGLRRMKPKLILSPCSNANISLMVHMARHNGFPWDCILGAETARAYKPMPEAYASACRLLSLPPAQVMMVAAHNGARKAAKSQGLATGFVPRPTEYGPGQTSDLVADPAVVDVAAASFVDLAEKLGC